MDHAPTITFPRFKCESCYAEVDNVVGSINETRQEFFSDSWTSVAVQCTECNKWSIKCRYCDDSSKYSSTTKDIAYRNNYTRFDKEHQPCSSNQWPYHTTSGTASANYAANNNDVNDDCFFEANDDDVDDIGTNDSQKIPPINFDAFNDNPPSYAYFSSENVDSHEKHKGLRGMVYRALNKAPPSTLSNSYSSSMLSLNLLLLTHVIMEVTGKTKQIVILLVLHIIEYIASQFEVTTRVPIFPHNFDEADRICAGKTPSSMWGQLPSEKVILLDDNKHVRISLDELIDHIMAFGAEIAWISDDKGNFNNPHADYGINGSQAAKEMLARCRECVRANGFNPDCMCVGYMTIWSDAFITAWVKQKDNSAWCQTVTIAPPEDNDRSEYHTHCIALGPKGADHNIVMDDLLEELKTIRKGKWRYYAHENRMVYTSFDVVCVLSDRPERSELTQMLDFSGKTSKRSRFVTNAPLEVLSSCDTCFRSNISELFNKSTALSASCTCCADWSYSTDHLIWEQKCTVEVSYPPKDAKKKGGRKLQKKDDKKEDDEDTLKREIKKLEDRLEKSKRKRDVGDNGGEDEKGQEEAVGRGSNKGEDKGIEEEEEDVGRGSNKGDDKGKEVGSGSKHPMFPRGFSFNETDPPPLKMPKGRNLPASYLAPCEQTFEWLEQGCKVTLHELTHNYSTRIANEDGWTKGSASNYMSSMGISTKIQEKIHREADRRRKEGAKSRIDTEADQGREEDANSMLDTEDAENKRSDFDWISARNEIIPALWTSGYKLDMFVDW